MNEQRWNLNLSKFLFLILSELFERVKNLALQCCGGGQISGWYYSILQTIFPPFSETDGEERRRRKSPFFLLPPPLIARISHPLIPFREGGGGSFSLSLCPAIPLSKHKARESPPRKSAGFAKTGVGVGVNSKLISSSLCKISCKFVIFGTF